MKQNCVTTTFDRLHRVGGRFVAAASRRSPLMHVWHEAADGTVTRYEPDRRLRHWSGALFGYPWPRHAHAPGRGPADDVMADCGVSMGAGLDGHRVGSVACGTIDAGRSTGIGFIDKERLVSMKQGSGGQSAQTSWVQPTDPCIS